MSHFDFIFLICYVNIVLDWVKKSFSKTLIDALNVTEHYRCFSTCPEPELIRAVANFRSLLELFSLWENKTVEMISPRAAYSLWIYFFWCKLNTREPHLKPKHIKPTDPKSTDPKGCDYHSGSFLSCQVVSSDVLACCHANFTADFQV